MKKLLLMFLSLSIFVTSLFAEEAKYSNVKWPEKIVFAVIPVASSREMSENFDPLVKYMEKELGIKVEFKVASDYAAVINGMGFKHVDVAYFGPNSYCEAAERAGAEAIAVEVDKSGSPGYYGYIITKKDSNLKTLEDIKGKTWAFTDPSSTSGTLVPTVFFAKKGIDPNKYFSKVIYSGSHEASILSVKNGKVESASTNNLDFERGLGKHWEKTDFNIIHKSDLIPGSPIAVRKDLPESLKMALKGVFVSFNDPVGLEKLKLKGYAPSDDKMYDGIRELIKFKKELKKKQQ